MLPHGALAFLIDIVRLYKDMRLDFRRDDSLALYVGRSSILQALEAQKQGVRNLV
jgi:hypothetical protein